MAALPAGLVATSGEPVRSTCPYCGVGCGVLVTPQADGRVTVVGDPQHPANFGRLCSKGAALGETLGADDRLTTPRIGAQPVDWQQAIGAVAEGFSDTIARHGPESVALYVSGQLLTEDYYVANKFAKGFLGTANIDTNSRLCMSSAVAAHQRAFGADLVPGVYEDLEEADLVVLVGSNAAWCHPVLYQRLMAARERRGSKLVVIDPRLTPTAEQADLHLPLAPGSDVLLFNGLLAYLVREGAVDFDYLEQHTEGFAETIRAAQREASSIPKAAAGCGLPEALLADFYRLFARTARVVTAFSQGVNQSSAGTDKGNAIINCHLLTGRIGKVGAGPFSLTGQPNAMGGREVGGLANQLAAHLRLESSEDRALVQSFWRSPYLPDTPGLKAVSLFDAVAEGRIKALWIIATNPVVSLPDADRVRAALARCELVVVSDMTETDTTAVADIVLPAASWGERDGTVTNSERCISRQRAFQPPPGQARPDWWIISEVAAAMGHGESFTYAGPAAIFAEHAALSARAAAGSKAFDLAGLAQLEAAEYERLEPIRWPVRADGSVGERLFTEGRFQTPSGRARLVPVQDRPPAHAPDTEYPLVLNTGRIRDQWHTMTRTGRVPRLSHHLPEPFAELHPSDAARAGVRQGELVRLCSPWGSMRARARLSAGQRPGSVFVPMHWNEQTAHQARVGAVVNPAVDPISGEPEFKHTPVRLERYAACWQGFALVREPLPQIAPWQVKVRHQDCWRYELAGETPMGEWSAPARTLLGAQPDDDWLEYEDRAGGGYRAALLRADRLIGCLFVSADDRLPDREWLSGLFAAADLDAGARVNLLAGRPAGAQAPVGEIICACFQVGRNTLFEAIVSQSLTSPAEIGEALQAGTNCGSCVPELKRLIAEVEA